jgi:hypothetical protein
MLRLWSAKGELVIILTGAGARCRPPARYGRLSARYGPPGALPCGYWNRADWSCQEVVPGFAVDIEIYVCALRHGIPAASPAKRRNAMASLAPVASTALAVTRVAGPASRVRPTQKAMQGKPPLLELLYGSVLGIQLGELPQPRPPRLLDQLRLVLRVRHYSRRTEDCYVNWARRFILFHHKRHPRTMSGAEVEQFLTHLAVNEHVSASSQNQALNALVFFFGQVLDMDLGKFDAVRARRGQRLPVVLTPEEVRLVLEHVVGADGLFRLMARLLYGCGLRVSECCGLRVHDIDLGRNQIMVRGGKGNKDRVVMLPRAVRAELEQQLAARRTVHERDLARGVARVDLPDALVPFPVGEFRAHKS